MMAEPREAPKHSHQFVYNRKECVEFMQFCFKMTYINSCVIV